MRLCSAIAAVGIAGPILVHATTPAESRDAHDVMMDLQNQALEALRSAEESSGSASAGCTLETAVVRQDWEKMSTDMRKDYIRAVQCLIASEPVLTENGWASRTRSDDFTAVHINLTQSIHGTGNFLSFHRYLVWTWEQALRDECGYEGYQPYWNWFKYQDDLKKSPVFDGSDTSMSGDGEYFAHNGSVAGGGTYYLESGEGGGCLKDGPFQNMTVSLGPLRPGMQGYPGGAVASAAVSNPRCLRRDLTMAASTLLRTEHLVNITTGEASGTIKLFQEELQAYNHPGFPGMHSAGHYSMGGDGTDLYSSINDPAFWHHHAMIDRVWWIWQALHPAEAKTIDGTITLRNTPPSRNATLNDTVTTLDLSPSRPLYELLDTVGGTPFCYIYQ